MRRCLIALCALALLAVGALLGANQLVSGWTDDVGVIQTQEQGDAAAADGLSIEMAVTSNRQLLWNTNFALNQPHSAQTDFAFSAEQQPDQSTAQPWIYLHTSANFGMSTSGGILEEERERYELEGTMIAPALELAEQAREALAGGETSPVRETQAVPSGMGTASTVYVGAEEPTAQARVDLSNYYEYYPVALEAGFPGAVAMELTDDQKRAVSNFFRIPVPEGEWADVAVELDGDGNLVGVEVNALGREETEWQMVSAVDESGAYLAFSLLSEESLLDFSNIPGGYGIYYLPFSWREETGRTRVSLHADALETVYSLDENEGQVQALTLSQDGESLLLFTRQEGNIWLTVIDRTTYVEKQRLPILTCGEEEAVSNLWSQPGFIVAALNTDRAVLLVEEEEGYVPRFELDLAAVNMDFAYALQSDGTFCYDGQRLAAAAVQGGLEENRHVRLAVWDESGLLTVQRLDNRLFAQSTPQYTLRVQTNPGKEGSLRLNWDIG